MPEEPELARISAGFPSEVLSVSQLNRSVRDMIEHRFPLLWVRGEISNCLVARSGHVYFALKDPQAQVRCVMFRSRAQQLGWEPRDGVEVEVQALVTLYEARGDFQLVIESMRRGGRGAMFEAFLRLKEKLEREGLFDAALKRPLPFFPRAIGIVTSLQAAALRDVLTTLARRNASIPVIVYPTPVQGEAAPAGIVRALARAGLRAECDVIIVCRGGGSIEDLWPFNDEAVARAIRACPIPVVSGVGHETDFCIADFAADRRAPTPTAAAELVSPARAELLAAAGALARRLTRRARREIEVRAQTVDKLAGRLAHPAQRLRDRSERLDHLRLRLSLSSQRLIEERAWRVSALAHRAQASLPRAAELGSLLRAQLERMRAALQAIHARCAANVSSLASNLEHLSPERVLERGYSVVRDAAGRVVNDAARLSPGDGLELSLARGAAGVRVESVRRKR
jgi:exodeoxyribonuclease VII large subunit